MTGKKTTHYITGLILCFSVSLLWGQENKTVQESLYSKGLYLYLEGQYVEAGKIFDQYMVQEPQDPRGCYFNGLCKLKLGDEKSAKVLFLKGAAREYTPKGRLMNIASALTKVQGNDRFLIEDARKTMKIAWEKREEDRQIKMYGETVDRQKDHLAQENRFLSGSNDTEKPQTGSVKSTQGLPVVSPISPLSQEEHDVVKIPDIGNLKSDDYKFFRDELGKTILSTSERKRIEERERRVVYTDPMQKPAADGTEFINIYDPFQRYTDTKPFIGEDDPDDLYQEAESGPLAVLSMLMDTTPQKGTDPQMGGESGADEMGMGSPASSAPLTKRIIKDETSVIFRGSDVPNTHANDEIAIPDPSKGLDLFENDRKFAPLPKDPAPGDNPEMSSME